MLDFAEPHPPAAIPEVLVLADALWVVWGPHVVEGKKLQPWRRYDQFVHELFGVSRSRDASSVALDGWLLPDPESDTLAEKLDGARGPAAEEARRQLEEHHRRQLHPPGPDVERSDGPDGRPWLTGLSAGRTLRQMIRDLRRANALCNIEDPAERERLFALLNLQACRIYLSGPQVQRLVGDAACRTPPHACLDVRFRGQDLGRYCLAVTLSLWAAPPASRAHAPEIARAGGQGRSADGWDAAASVAVSNAFHERLENSFTPAQLTVFDQRYSPPRFWIARGGLLDSPDTGRRAEALESITQRTFHVSAESSLIARGHVQINRDGARMHVLRRFDAGTGPCYLLVLDALSPAFAQEDAVREFIYKLTDIETRAAVLLHRKSLFADNYAKLSQSYLFAARRGDVLWDELAMGLPTARGRELDRLHEQAELIHQVLLQGIADLQAVQTSVHELSTKIDDSSEHLVLAFDRALSETTEAGHEPIRDAVVHGGYFATTQQFVQATAAVTARAQETYQGLLNGLTLAFDERRVRLTDKISVIALVAALALAVLPIFSEAWGAFLGRESTGIWAAASVVLSGLGLAAIVAVLILALWFRRYRLGALRTSAHFPDTYRNLQQYLLACRTDQLSTDWEAARQEVSVTASNSATSARRVWRGFLAGRNNFDADLSRQCAATLDGLRGWIVEEQERLRKKKLRSNSEGQRRERLRHEVERWALCTLFVTERPRQFFWYPLPQLTLLYRAFPAWDLFGQRPAYETPPPLVADSDLRLELRVHCRAYPKEITEVFRWTDALRARARQYGLSAGQVLQEIEEMRIRAGMRRRDWQDVCDAMRPSSAHAAAPQSPAAADQSVIKRSRVRRSRVVETTPR